MAQNQGTTGGKSQGQSGMQGTSGMQGQSGSQQSGMQGQTGTQRQSGLRTGDTGTDNVTYDLVSVVYHALQAAQTYQQYERDAQRGNQQMADFFRRVCENNKQCAEEGLQLLHQCLMAEGQGQGAQAGQSAPSGQSGSGQYGRGTM